MNKRELINRKGFTLIELVIVIVILGILVALSSLAYNAHLAKIEEEALVSNLRVLKSASIYFSAEHQGKVPKSFEELAGKTSEHKKEYIDSSLYEIASRKDSDLEFILEVVDSNNIKLILKKKSKNKIIKSLDVGSNN